MEMTVYQSLIVLISIGFMARFLKRCRLIMEVISFDWIAQDRNHNLICLIERTIPHLAGDHVVSKWSMQLIFEVKSLASALIDNSAEYDSNQIQFIGCLKHGQFIALPVPDLTVDQIHGSIGVPVSSLGFRVGNFI
jgi:hypothetical protein